MSVLVYTENWDGKFKNSTFELVSFGAAVAEMLGQPLHAVSIGSVEGEELQKLGKYGVSKVLNVQDEQLKVLDNRAWSRIITEAAGAAGASVVLLAHNNTGKAIAPRIAVRLKAALGAGLTALPESTEPFVVRKKVFSGKAFASVALKTPAKVLTLTQNTYQVNEMPVDMQVEDFRCDYGPVETEVSDVQKQSGQLLLTDAEIVVSGGRGMKAPDNWNLLEELAGTLGAATACTRPVSDEGWRPHEEHTGQTGKIIAPNLYIAAGVSGAIQHLAGVSGSKCLVAINNDKDAPIFEAADYGIVGDALKVLPEITKAAKERH